MREQTLMKPVLAVALTLLLAACGSASGGTGGGSGSGSAAGSPTPTTSATTTTPAASAPATTPTTATTTTSTSSSTTATATTTRTTAASGTPPCRAATLALSFVGQQGGMGHGEIGFALRNTGSTPCRTYGYPGVLFLDQQGRPLTTIPHHTTQDFFGSGPAVPLVIAPGAGASFRLDVGHGVATSAGCDTATLRTTIPNGAYECHDADVSPLRAGQSAYP